MGGDTHHTRCRALHAPLSLPSCSFIGFMCGAVCYFLQYPSLFAPDCHIPKLRGPAAGSAGLWQRHGQVQQEVLQGHDEDHRAGGSDACA